MQKRRPSLAWMTVLVAIALGTACSDDTMTGPMFGALAFSPSFSEIDTERMIELTISNESSVSLGPILVGPDGVVFRSLLPEFTCPSMTVTIVPASITALAPGAETTVEVTIDTQNVDSDQCPPDQYDADIFAAVGGRVLGGATVRFVWSGTPP